jgi:hypothetical protein
MHCSFVRRFTNSKYIGCVTEAIRFLRLNSWVQYYRLRIGTSAFGID